MDYELPPLLIQFTLTTVFSFFLGLEQRKKYPNEKEKLTFGTDRTFTFIGILGFALLIADEKSKWLYLGGGLILSLFLGIFYFYKIKTLDHYGLTSILLALLTYTLPLITVTQPYWMTLLFFVVVMLLVESKEAAGSLSQKIDRSEFITLIKFILIAGIILPIVPDKQILSFLNLSPYKVWLAIVVISGISYLSYLLRKFVFPQAGLLLTGVLGGLYSSTATTIILSKKSKETENADYSQYAAAIILATAMMFLRIFILVLIFNRPVALKTAVWFGLMFLLSIGVAIYLHRSSFSDGSAAINENIFEDKNPLEFKVALIFAGLYVLFSFVTQYTLTNFGGQGLSILSWVVGFTDIDPFLLNLFQGKYNVTALAVGMATFQAIVSNNILKLGYGIGFGDRRMIKFLVQGFGGIIVANIAVILVLYFWG